MKMVSGIPLPGNCSQYLLGLRDADEEFLTGENTYRMHIPPNVPAANFWSVVLYDADTRALLDNGEPYADLEMEALGMMKRE
jgi:hypothetical protein